MCNKPSFPGKISTKAPNSKIDLILPSYVSPTSGTTTIPLTQFKAATIASLDFPEIATSAV